MANTSIYAAFERFWQHVVAALGNKADTSYVDTKLEEITPSPWTLDEDTGCFYRPISENNSYGAIEWLNPPMDQLYEFYDNGDGTGMVVGEYRTAERYCGLPVYTCIVDTGAGVTGSAHEKITNVAFYNTIKVIRDNGLAINSATSEVRALPYYDHHDNKAQRAVFWQVHSEANGETGVSIYERSHTGRTGWNVYVQLWYTKALPTWVSTATTE